MDMDQLIEIAHDPSVFLTGVIGLGMLAQWLAWRFRLPSILLLLAFGFSARYFFGIDPGRVIQDDLLFALVSLFVAIILFEGGLTLRLHEIEDSKGVVTRLVTIGVVVTWILAGVAGYFLLGMDWRVAALAGAILTVTGPTVVGPMLRHIRPSKNVAAVIKWEGIVVDPIGALLAVLVFEALFLIGNGHHGDHESGYAVVLFILGKTLLVGVGLAVGAGLIMLQFLKRYWVPDYLHNFIFLAITVVVFTASNLLQHESGLVTVTVLGILIANQKSFPVNQVLEFKESLRDLLISTLFIVLSARIEASQIEALGWGGLAFVALLILVIRPLSVWASCLGSSLKWNEQTFIAALAPRGIVAAAVSTVFALKLETSVGEEIPNGTDKLVPMTFLVIVGTVAVYGLLAPLLARRIGLSTPNPQGILFAGASEWVRNLAKVLQESGFRVQLVDTNYQNVAIARQAGIPSVCASVLSEFVEEEVDFSGIGRMLAVTPNDDLNRLAALEYGHHFGKANVYQLDPTDGGRRDTSSPHVEGRFLFAAELSFKDIQNRTRNGAVIKKTRLTDEFTFDDFLRVHGENAVPMFGVTDNGILQVSTNERPLEPTPGLTLIALVDDSADIQAGAKPETIQWQE